MIYKSQSTLSKNQTKYKLFKTQRFVLLRFVRFVWNICVLCFVFFTATFPGVIFAATQPTNLTEFVNNFITVLNVVIPFVAGLGFFGFLIGVLKYVGAGGDEERLGKAKQLILYGLIGLLVMFSFWGLAKLLANTYLSLGV